MGDRRMRPGTFGIPIDENHSLSELQVLIEINIAHTHLILQSIQDITRLPRAASPNPRNRDSGFFEPRGLLNGDDLSRKLLEFQRRVEETRTCLRELQRANLRGLQLMLECPEGPYTISVLSKLYSADREFRTCNCGASVQHQSKPRCFERDSSACRTESTTYAHQSGRSRRVLAPYVEHKVFKE
jgi:hypothetical protein